MRYFGTGVKLISEMYATLVSDEHVSKSVCLCLKEVDFLFQQIVGVLHLLNFLWLENEKHEVEFLTIDLTRTCLS